MQVLTKAKVPVILQNTDVSNQQVVLAHLKLTQCYLSIVSQ